VALLDVEPGEVLKEAAVLDSRIERKRSTKQPVRPYPSRKLLTGPAPPRRLVCALEAMAFFMIPKSSLENLEMTLSVTAVLPWLLIDVGASLGYQLVRQNGRILLRLEAIEKRIATRPSEQRHEKTGGLPVGTVSPDFELPDLAGVGRKLSEFRGQDVLLIFFSPKYGFCTKIAADLAALAVDGGDGRAVPIVVTTGDANENRKLALQYGIRCVVLAQEQMEVANQYRAQGTPMSYWIDREGRIASELAVGARPLVQGGRLCGNLARLHKFVGNRGAKSWRVSHPHPVFSADGRRIHFNINAGQHTQLYVAEVTS
jgi:peroxiredoxin